MACTQSATSVQQRSSAATSVARVAKRWWRSYWNWRAREATVLILRSLDRRTLRDIGIDPREIRSCVYGESGDRRRRYDEAWPWRSGGA